MNLNRLMAIYDLVERPDLKYPAFTPSMPKRLIAKEDIFAVMREGELLLHHPFESFAPVIDFLRQAASDPDVLAIKQTLYRAGPQSPVVDALVDAARAGKEVTVIIELMARFDEAANIRLATRLQEAGAHVMYGVVGYKTHAKLIMVVRRESGKLRRYCHCGTGNYHPEHRALLHRLRPVHVRRGRRRRSARAVPAADQPDARRDDAEDPAVAVHAARSAAGKDQARDRVGAARQARAHHRQDERADRAADHPGAVSRRDGGRESRSDRARHLRAAPGHSRHLGEHHACARSSAGFLEHSRVYYFHNDGNPEIYCASADWMERNFFRRIEVCFPIERKQHRDRIVEDLETYLADNTQAWVLGPGRQIRRASSPADAPAVSAQETLLRRYADSATTS